MVRAGYVDFEKKQSSIIGVPQGGIVSPILSNLVLNELDKYVERLIKENEMINDGKSHTIRNSVYSKMDERIQTIRRIAKRTESRGVIMDPNLISERNRLIKTRSLTPSTLPNDKLAKFYYVRYADD